PYFRFQAYRVSRLMPSRRHSSRTFAPASASLTAATFCSSVNLLLRMTPPRSVRRSQIISGSGFGGQLQPRPSTAQLPRLPDSFTAPLGVTALSIQVPTCDDSAGYSRYETFTWPVRTYCQPWPVRARNTSLEKPAPNTRSSAEGDWREVHHT